MVRQIVKIESEREVYDWDFEVDLDLNFEIKPKIAFLSGLGRSYYPGDPGYSKFGIVYQLNIDDNPPPTYVHSEDRIQRPISTKGYGIGGLSGPRLGKLNNGMGSDAPSPDKYQRYLNEPILEPNRRPVPPEEDIRKLDTNDPFVVRMEQKALEAKDKQCRVAFGSLNSQSRFGKGPRFNVAGVGTYNLGTKQISKRYAQSSFGRKPIIYDHSTRIRCIYSRKEFCFECGNHLVVSDYYRTRYAVEVPLPEGKRKATFLEKNPSGMANLNLCNFCYYKTLQGVGKNWSPSEACWLFRKTRTCATIHEHHSFPEIVHKTNCKIIRRLQMKESTLSKYYRDRVEESVPDSVIGLVKKKKEKMMMEHLHLDKSTHHIQPLH